MTVFGSRFDFLTNSTLLITCKGREQSAARPGDGDFRRSQHVAGHLEFVGNFDYLSNSESFSSSVLFFWADSTPVKTHQSLKFYAA
jgi:hypothetical protein